MLYYYYPLSSKDFTFENIFSSESISPPFFYPKRDFGIGYFPVIPEVNHNDAILLYSKPPMYEVENSTKFILQVEESCLDMDSLIFVSEGIFAYQKTIYLNKINFKLNFFSEKEKRISILKAETSLPTKYLDKYLKNFQLITENDCYKYTFCTKNININIFSAGNLIQADKKFNQFKGLVYGIASHLNGRKSREELFFKKLIREMVNSFAELKSNSAGQKYTDPKSLFKKKSGFNNSTNYSNRIFDIIKITEKAYTDFFEDVDFTDDSLIELLYEKTEELNSIEDARQYIHYLKVDDEVFGSARFEELKKKFLKQNSLLKEFAPLESLKRQITLFLDEAIYSNNSKLDIDELNDDIRITFHEIDRYISELFQNQTPKQPLSIEGLKFSFENNEITIAGNFQRLTSEEINEMVLINNVILKYSEKDKALSKKDAILQIVKQVGSIFSKGGKETTLYQYLNNQIDTYEFEKISNAVMKNFVAFIFNVESLEKLENFINIKDIENEWMAYSFWGSFNGFANLSGNFTKSIFSDDSESIQIYLEEYLKDYIDTLKALNPGSSPNHYVEEKKENYDKFYNIDQAKNFYQTFVADKFNLSKEEFISVYSIKDKEVFYTEVKSKFKMNKKTAEKLFVSIKRDFDSPLLFN